jgi:hypothetical protein
MDIINLTKNCVVVKNFLSTDMVDSLLEYGRQNASRIEIGSYPLTGTIHDEGRNLRQCDILWIPAGNFDSMSMMLLDVVKEINKKNKWGIKVGASAHHEPNGMNVRYPQEHFQLTWYRGGGHYGWHKDYWGPDSGQWMTKYRMISITTLLSSKDEFSGGDFQIKPKWVRENTENGEVYGAQDEDILEKEAGETITVDMDKGDLVVFRSKMYHRVTDIIDGERKSLVAWYHGSPSPKIANKINKGL